MLKSAAIPFFLILLGYVVIADENFTVILSGIAIFIIGMFFMQDGFKQLSGGILEKLLEKFTSNTLYAILTGFLSTSVVQSSTIITLIVVSFLSAELLTLVQAVGIVFGSNVGSTTTAWIVSSLGVDVKISTYAFPMLVFGVVLRFFKSNGVKGSGNVLLGLGFIFLGISYMKDGFDIMKNSIDLASYAMEGYLGIIVYILIGILITVVIQSSAATLAIVITALNADSITYVNAIALAIGANVGTTLTTILASFASNENGKRVALIHFLFNLISATFITILIYQFIDLTDFIAPFLGVSDNNYGMKLALFHTIFSVTGVILLIPAISLLVKLSEKLIQKKVSSASKPKYLNQSVLSNPDASLAALRKEIINLYENCQKAMLHALNIHTTGLTRETLKVQLAKELTIIDTDIDEIYQKNLKALYSEIVKFSSFAQENMFDFQHKKVDELKRAAVLLVEVLRDTRDIQKNVNFYLKSKNEYIKEEYNILRKELAEMLIDINTLSMLENDSDQLTQFELIKTELAHNDLASSEELDTLIREDKIKATMATSYMNDSATGYSIQKKLVKVANILFLNDGIVKQIGDENETK
ncbi:Na/Pi cotransporter family protein [Aliarcobacter cryaerophilus]|uniref:Na/Pi cotransporter family protein n=1 Tax=Aliarcobacter cryaerophilus TaxID=28198 RepID=UPI0021B422F3|nr:Na/Pi symporter [Aliarcobacter cryaerophilus]MCT7444076.1 Na/Pi symporter [Aliarcobacter cryaerophilus]MCT7478436.1 Na/Pi symporter [Aliarcobacter cryaerophilus]MCT7482227.1 Na/Pi symporter [Aliarcobacter cryaerophilus]MCT7487619.1 Na/Pi symporter [Aliarcobacter cryaerophilus]MCT7512691.1 Na/Pi symporter [Aliarcobacter cryaerophilus]